MKWKQQCCLLSKYIMNHHLVTSSDQQNLVILWSIAQREEQSLHRDDKFAWVLETDFEKCRCSEVMDLGDQLLLLTKFTREHNQDVGISLRWPHDSRREQRCPFGYGSDCTCRCAAKNFQLGFSLLRIEPKILSNEQISLYKTGFKIDWWIKFSWHIITLFLKKRVKSPSCASVGTHRYTVYQNITIHCVQISLW